MNRLNSNSFGRNYLYSLSNMCFDRSNRPTNRRRTDRPTADWPDHGKVSFPDNKRKFLGLRLNF